MRSGLRVKDSPTQWGATVQQLPRPARRGDAQFHRWRRPSDLRAGRLQLSANPFSSPHAVSGSWSFAMHGCVRLSGNQSAHSSRGVSLSSSVTTAAQSDRRDPAILFPTTESGQAGAQPPASLLKRHGHVCRFPAAAPCFRHLQLRKHPRSRFSPCFRLLLLSDLVGRAEGSSVKVTPLLLEDHVAEVLGPITVCTILIEFRGLYLSHSVLTREPMKRHQCWGQILLGNERLQGKQ